MMEILSIPAFTASETMTLSRSVLVALGMSCLYIDSLVIFRLWLSPLKRYPGPTLAALTQWVETFHEIRGDGGQFMFKLDEWHKKYGPIVRISPHEVHIRDSEFYKAFYSGVHIADRRTVLANRFGIPLSSHFTSDHQVHRKRREAMNPMFSQRKVLEFCHSIQAITNRACDIIDARYGGTGKALNLNAMWGCLASDLVSQYALGISFDFIETQNFDSAFVKGMANILEPLHIVTQFPIIGRLLMQLPDWLNIRLQPSMAPVLLFKAIKTQVCVIKEATERSDEVSKSDRHETIISAVLQSKLPLSERSIERVSQEAIGIVGAGVETIYRALTVGSYYILSRDSVRLSLEQELAAVIPEPLQMPSYEKLKQLPYLSACVKEVERIGIGTSQRSPRIFRVTTPEYSACPLVLDQAFSMSIRDVHFDPVIFPSPQEFLPERWLPIDFVPDGRPLARPYQPRTPSGQLLSQYLVPFARGPRNCAGMHFAEAELYIGLASIMRRFAGRIALAEGVGRESVDIWMDRFVPREKPGAKNVCVMVGV